MTMMRIFLEFFRRDFHVYIGRLPRYMVQYAVIYPILFGICYGYLVPQAGGAPASSVIFAGTLLFSIVPFCFAITSDFLFDFEHDRFVDYQLTLVPARLIIVQRILLSALFICIGLLPFFLSSKIIFKNLIDLPYVSWIGTLGMLISASLFASAFQIAFASYAKGTKQIRHFWRRVSYPLSMLGGFLVPWKVLMTFSPILGYVVLVNPYLYITEGLRSAILGGDQFFYWPYCMAILATFTLVFTWIAFFFFDKKVDPIV